MQLDIEDAQLRYIAALERIEQHVFVVADGLLNKRSFRYHIHRKKNLLLVARKPSLPGEHDATPLGYILVLLHKRSARIYSLAVDPEYQKQGVGSALLVEALRRLDKIEIPLVYLEVREENTRALKRYESIGFVRSHTRPDYYGCAQDAVIMVRSQTGRSSVA